LLLNLCFIRVFKRGAYGAPEKTKFFWGVKPLFLEKSSPSPLKERGIKGVR